jgi:tripartite-type tricarboxylate transporter receptor subunit TctC
MRRMLFAAMTCVSMTCMSIVAGVAPLRADPIEDFYKGKTISMVVSSSTGGGYDTLSRMLTKYITRHLPGNPNIVIRNMPGAGGIVATNHLYSIAAKDGTVIGGVQNNTPFEPLFGTKEATFDPTKSHWLGSPGAEVGTLAVWGASPVKTLDDARRHETTVGAAGINSTPSFYARMMNMVAGTKLKIVTGYPGQSEIFIAMERGEVEGHPSVFYGGLKSTRPTWISDKKVNFLLQYGAEREKELGDTPFLSDLVTRPEDRALVAAALAPLAIGRPYLTPPETPPERIAALRKALADTFADPEFRADADRMQLGLTTPVSGESMQQRIAEAYNTPPEVVTRLRALAQP